MLACNIIHAHTLAKFFSLNPSNDLSRHNDEPDVTYISRRASWAFGDRKGDE